MYSGSSKKPKSMCTSAPHRNRQQRRQRYRNQNRQWPLYIRSYAPTNLSRVHGPDEPRSHRYYILDLAEEQSIRKNTPHAGGIVSVGPPPPRTSHILKRRIASETTGDALRCTSGIIYRQTLTQTWFRYDTRRIDLGKAVDNKDRKVPIQNDGIIVPINGPEQSLEQSLEYGYLTGSRVCHVNNYPLSPSYFLRRRRGFIACPVS
ncbi:hypothetical protein FN846DRAFT_249593 [Sphaerosporella brunnea]|uniref:Uncharacterized protein n=1 Tax=Sphaerosporella brunnea TaxID=1250544 RepID=A0A5J5FBF9_9PEZI|nr:hypothetical protein FN846DRAFT_249593 [Sphaerosporella brunnea]